MGVKGVSGTTITVIRGVGSTAAVSHASSALVVVVPTAAIGLWGGGEPMGSSQRAARFVHAGQRTVSAKDSVQQR